MKKMMIAAAALMVAVVSQAAVVDWGYKITADKTVASVAEAQASAYAKNYVVYLFAADAVADWKKVTKADFDSAMDSSAIQYQSWTSRAGATYATANALGEVGTARAVDVGDAASLVAKIVILDTVNNKYVATDATIASRSETAGAGTEGVQSFTQAAFAGQSWTAVAVPEPTSGLLMLVGLAGLALRRRRA